MDYNYFDDIDSSQTNAKSFRKKIRDFIWDIDCIDSESCNFAGDFIEGKVKFTDHYPAKEHRINYYEKISGLCKCYFLLFVYTIAVIICGCIESVRNAANRIDRIYIYERDSFIKKASKTVGSAFLNITCYILEFLSTLLFIFLCTTVNSITAIENFVAKGANYCVKSIKSFGAKCKDSVKFCLSYIPFVNKFVGTHDKGYAVVVNSNVDNQDKATEIEDDKDYSFIMQHLFRENNEKEKKSSVSVII